MNRQVEQLAYRLRARVRAKAGLSCNWIGASDAMKEFYRALARRCMER